MEESDGQQTELRPDKGQWELVKQHLFHWKDLVVRLNILVAGFLSGVFGIYQYSAGPENYFNVNCVAYSPDSQLIASGTDDNKLWNAASESCFVSMSTQMQWLAAVLFLAGSNAVLDGPVRAWDLMCYRTFTTPSLCHWLQTKVERSSVLEHPFQIYVWPRPQWSQGTGVLGFLVTGQNRAPVDVFEGKGGVETFTHMHDVLTVVYRPDGKQLGCSTLDGQIHFWDPIDGVLMGTIEGRRDVAEGRLMSDRRTAANSSSGKCFTTMSYSADGSLLLAGGTSKYICMYDATNQAINDALESKRYSRALMLALRLNEPLLIQKCVEAVAISGVVCNISLSHLGDELAQYLEKTPHLEFLLQDEEEIRAKRQTKSRCTLTARLLEAEGVAEIKFRREEPPPRAASKLATPGHGTLIGGEALACLRLEEVHGSTLELLCGVSILACCESCKGHEEEGDDSVPDLEQDPDAHMEELDHEAVQFVDTSGFAAPAAAKRTRGKNWNHAETMMFVSVFVALQAIDTGLQTLAVAHIGLSSCIQKFTHTFAKIEKIEKEPLKKGANVIKLVVHTALASNEPVAHHISSSILAPSRREPPPPSLATHLLVKKP
ncbi:hypothetical protein SELMODRAFT_426332 [Selaginella moellendorffii]|uniref:Uncharacterized protein n=1 Tax=Selaginella moellendorffii TaxID=88036 RepID=D8SW20_SELML|nr:hypothetical protein SELMODRAFT_426332 [Selaginella moellendorffii]